MSRISYRNVWIKHHGPIPTDENGRSYDIHHKDGNRKNNNITNLHCCSIQEHYDIHYIQGDWSACKLIMKRLVMSLTEFSMQQKALSVGDKNGNYGNRGSNNPKYKERLVKTCENCQEQFECPQRFKDQRFCSHECHGVWLSNGNHYKYNGGKTIQVICQQCSEPFFVYRNSTRKYCSKVCTNIGVGLSRKGSKYKKTTVSFLSDHISI